LVNRNHQEIIGRTNDNNKTINTEGNQITEGNHIDIEIPNSYMQPNNITEVNQNSKKIKL
jgi:hypothetical protein